MYKMFVAAGVGYIMFNEVRRKRWTDKQTEFNGIVVGVF